MTPPKHPRLSTDATFAVVPTWVLDSPISSNAVRLYAVLARYTDTDGVCYPGRRLLATRMQVGSMDTVDRAMRDLVTIGAVTITRRYNDKREPIASLYRLHVTPGGVAANLRVGSRKDAREVAAPVRHRTRTTERENPPTPAADAAGEQRAHHGQHKRCRACGTTPRQQLAADTLNAQRKPPWCGHCDETSRTIEFEPAGPNTHPTVQRCHACHPLEIGA